MASATQRWVHVRADLKLARASDALIRSFPTEDRGPAVTLPAHDPIEEARTHVFELDCWHTWMDPLGHVNHPAYVDWADEALSRAMVRARIERPSELRGVAESAHFASGVTAGERVRVETRLTGRTRDGAAVFSHAILADERSAASVVTVRRLRGEADETRLLDLC